MIRETKTYPVTLLASASKIEKKKLSDAGIVTLDDLLEVDSIKSISQNNLFNLKDEANRISR
jgi:hypothetical protein